MTTFLEKHEHVLNRIDRLTASIARLNKASDTDAATIRRLRHEIDVQTARADVAEAWARGQALDDDGNLVLGWAELERE